MTPTEKSNLLAELGRTLRMIDAQLMEIRRDVSDKDQWADDPEVYRLRDANGSYIAMPLIVARAQVLNAIATIKMGK